MPAAVPRSLRDWLKVLALALIYLGLAKLGLRLATVTRSVTLVWPPTGISLAALRLVGPRLWPGVAVGAFLANVTTPGVPVWTAGAIAVGNTLEAVVGATLLRRFGFQNGMGRISDVGRLGLAAAASTPISATAGTLSLVAAGLLTLRGAAMGWLEWWLGDLMGDLIFAPLLLTWRAERGLSRAPARIVEGIALAASLPAVCLVVFGVAPARWGPALHQPYAVFPFFVWAAVRFGLRGVTAANFTVSMVTVAATLRGAGPFAGGSLDENLFQLQTFMGLAVTTTLVLGAAVAERNRAIRRRDDFLSMAAHELRNPIHTVQLGMHSLGRALARGGTNRENLGKTIERSARQTERLSRLVEQLLDVSQIAAGRLALEPRDMDLGELVREVVERFGDPALPAPPLLRVEAASVPGRWDRLRVDQVVSNLVSNALKYGAGKPIEVRVRRRRDEAEIVVRDHGIGIPPEHLERVFERFERVAPERATSGFGLGLWITKQIVTAAGGRIALRSEPDAGTTVTVALPLEPPRH